jgi:hypothetical protein
MKPIPVDALADAVVAMVATGRTDLLAGLLESKPAIAARVRNGFGKMKAPQRDTAARASFLLYWKILGERDKPLILKCLLDLHYGGKFTTITTMAQRVVDGQISLKMQANAGLIVEWILTSLTLKTWHLTRLEAVRHKNMT